MVIYNTYHDRKLIYTMVITMVIAMVIYNTYHNRKLSPRRGDAKQDICEGSAAKDARVEMLNDRCHTTRLLRPGQL